MQKNKNESNKPISLDITKAITHITPNFSINVFLIRGRKRAQTCDG